jgi:hypothetical protein
LVSFPGRVSPSQGNLNFEPEFRGSDRRLPCKINAKPPGCKVAKRN